MDTVSRLVPPVITTGTTTDFIPSMDKLTSPGNMWQKGAKENLEPSVATSALTEAAAALQKKTVDIPMTKKEFSTLTVGQIYNNTIKTVVSIVNDFGDIVSDREMMTNTEFRRQLLGMFLLEERRMYVGIVLILLSFILYFIDSSA